MIYKRLGLLLVVFLSACATATTTTTDGTELELATEDGAGDAVPKAPIVAIDPDLRLQ